KFLRDLTGHKKHVHGLAFAGRTLISAGEHDGLRVWDWSTGKTTGAISVGLNNVHELRGSPDGQVIAAALTGPGVKRWALPALRELPPLDGAGMAWSVAFSPDGTMLATSHEAGSVKLWSAADGKMLAAYRGHKGPVPAIAFAPDGQSLATAGADRTIKRWRVKRP